MHRRVGGQNLHGKHGAHGKQKGLSGLLTDLVACLFTFMISSRRSRPFVT